MPSIQGKEVGPIGFGLMGFTWRATPCSQEQAFETMHAALANGSTYPALIAVSICDVRFRRTVCNLSDKYLPMLH